MHIVAYDTEKTSKVLQLRINLHKTSPLKSVRRSKDRLPIVIDSFDDPVTN
jgi:hypothetical protein